MGEVEFEEQQNLDEIPQPKLEPHTFREDLVDLGIVRNIGDAAIIMAIFALLLFFLSIYIITTSISSPKSLDEDVLQYGESVPEYLK